MSDEDPLNIDVDQLDEELHDIGFNLPTIDTTKLTVVNDALKQRIQELERENETLHRTCRAVHSRLMAQRHQRRV
jgi:uncharacterized protein Smg (DUF494 family)